MQKNDFIVDMHIHSTASDGALTPKDCIRQAVDLGANWISLTDHDTISGFLELDEDFYGVKIIPGVELSAEYEKELHILGYNFDPFAKPIKDILKTMTEERVHRNRLIIQKLNDLNIPIDYDEMINNYNSDVFGRVHIAKELIDKGFAKDLKEAFLKYLSSGQKAYVKRELPSKEECIGSITKSGGFAVLAHPIFLSLHRKDLIDFIDELANIGLSGVEAYHIAQDEAYSSYIVNICEDRKLLCTAGTDTHGLGHEIYKPVSIKNEYLMQSIEKIFA